MRGFCSTSCIGSAACCRPEPSASSSRDEATGGARRLVSFSRTPARRVLAKVARAEAVRGEPSVGAGRRGALHHRTPRLDGGHGLDGGNPVARLAAHAQVRRARHEGRRDPGRARGAATVRRPGAAAQARPGAAHGADHQQQAIVMRTGRGGTVDHGGGSYAAVVGADRRARCRDAPRTARCLSRPTTPSSRPAAGRGTPLPSAPSPPSQGNCRRG